MDNYFRENFWKSGKDWTWTILLKISRNFLTVDKAFLTKSYIILMSAECFSLLTVLRSYHDDDGFGFDSFGTGSVAESIGGLGVVGLGRGHAGYLHTTLTMD